MKFELEPYQGEVSADDIISDLKNLARKLDKNTLTQREYNKYGKYSHKTVRVFLFCTIFGYKIIKLHKRVDNYVQTC
jgi:hypothetical protein